MNNTFESLKHMFAPGRKDPSLKKIAHNTWLKKHGDKEYGVIFHQTEIINATPNKIFLNCEGWSGSITTRERLNKYLKGIEIYQRNNVRYIKIGEQESIYYDGLTIKNNKVIRPISITNQTKRHKLNKEILSYVKEFKTLFSDGKIPPPSGGDCWLCLLVDGSTDKPWRDKDTEHLLEHIKEKYYVPSIISNACVENAGLLSKVASGILALWIAKMPLESWAKEIACDQIFKAVKKYLQKRLLN